MLDETTEFGARAARRLREEIIGWLTTVSPDGAPQPIPVWFLWDGDGSILFYSRPGTPKLRNIDRNPKVSLNLDRNSRGGDIVVCWGEARPSGDPPSSDVREYMAKYGARIAEMGWTPDGFAADYSVPIRISITRIHGH